MQQSVDALKKLSCKNLNNINQFFYVIYVTMW